MSFQDAEIIRRTTALRGNIPGSIPSCERFEKLTAAKDHAKKTSREKNENRHVIHTGDYFFSSTTAQIFWYERLIISYCNGVVADNRLTEKDLNTIYHE